MSAAVYIGVIASLTGWTEDFIRWHLPLSRGWAYFHAQRALAGETRVWAQPDKAETAFRSRVDSFLDKHRPS